MLHKIDTTSVYNVEQKKQWHKDLLFIYWGFQVVLNFMFAISVSIDNILELYNFYEWKCL